jgi:hypothetical protein
VRSNYTQPNVRGRILDLRLFLLVAAVVLGVGGCGGDDDRPAGGSGASQTQADTSTAEKSGGERSDRDQSGGRTSGGSGTSRNDGASSGGGSGGARAPKATRPLRKKSLQRYLAKHYRLTPWYGELKRIGVSGGHVRVYTTLSPESDDESPPVLACTAVRSYGHQVKKVTVYGSTASLVPTNVLVDC